MSPWQHELQEGFRNSAELLNFLHLNPEDINLNLSDISSIEFPLRVPLSFAQRMEKENPKDPLLLQVLPRTQELESPSHFLSDAVGDIQAIKSKGVIQKYQGRILVIMTGACAVHCRYCFRRHFPYSDNTLSPQSKGNLFNILSNDPSIEELIFSGGDPLLLSNNSLKEWGEQLLKIPHLKRWRFHSRLLSVLPSRFDNQLREIYQEFQLQGKQIILVNHFNHPQEVKHKVLSSLKLLKNTGITLLNQSVLLKDINDQVQILKALSLALFENGILPYYLHLLDRTKGTHHFEVSEEDALKIYHDLSSQLPGYLVPKLVREEMGKPYKTPINLSLSNRCDLPKG